MTISALPQTLDEWRDVIHPAALLLPRPSAGEYADLKASVEERGILQPLTTYVDLQGDHWLIDGISRLQIMVELGMTVIGDDNQWVVPTTAFYEEKGDDPYAIALSLNLARRHLTNEQKREVISDLLEQRPDLSDRAIARMAGVSPHTVADERRELQYDEPPDDETEEPPSDTDEPPEEEERFEETGRRARGRRAGTTTTPTTDAGEADEPFSGSVRPSAGKTSRVAEARRCVKWLRLEVDDLLPKSRRATLH